MITCVSVLVAVGLDCLCSILKCMVEWSREYYIDPATTGLNAVYRPSTSADDGEDLSQEGSSRHVRAASVSIRQPQSEPSKG